MRVLVPVLAALFATACAHRPTFREVLESASATGDATQVQLQVVDPATRAPLSGVSISFGDGKQRTRLKTGPDGQVTLPITPALIKDNPLVEVNRPSGGGYLLTAAPRPAAPVAPPAEPAAPAPDPAAPDLDGGTPPAP